MEQIILQGIKAEDLFGRIDKLQEQMNVLSKLFEASNPNSANKTPLSRKDVCVILKISLPTLNSWTKSGLIPSYRIGTRILYKTEDVYNALDQRKFIKPNLKKHGA